MGLNIYGKTVTWHSLFNFFCFGLSVQVLQQFMETVNDSNMDYKSFSIILNILPHTIWLELADVFVLHASVLRAMQSF